jgi:hypothetical protein
VTHRLLIDTGAQRAPAARWRRYYLLNYEERLHRAARLERTIKALQAELAALEVP